jgi:hypothetical protein
MLQVREEYRREFLEMYRMNWKLHYLRCKDIYPLCWTVQWMTKWFEKYLKRADKGGV